MSPLDLACVHPDHRTGVPVGIGTDVVALKRLERSLTRDGFAEAVFSDEERRYCAAQARPSQHFAARFAAKEAFLKALGAGVFGGVPLPEIEVVHGAGGVPCLRLGPAAERALRRLGASRSLVSLSHDGPVAVAFVVLA